jgi:hypothetical protein
MLEVHQNSFWKTNSLMVVGSIVSDPNSKFFLLILDQGFRVR